MPIVTTNQIEPYLFTDRYRTGLVVVEGTFHPIGSGIEQVPPLVIASKHPDYEGFNSGRRSVLVAPNGYLLKYKGCAIDKTSSRRPPYRKLRGVGCSQPLGGSLLSYAINEVELTIRLNEILTQNGFEVPYEPLGYIDYGKTFEPNQWSLFLSIYRGLSSRLKLFSPIAIVKALLEYKNINPNFTWLNGNLGATVMKVRGDTRLPEIFSSAIYKERIAEEVAHKLGTEVGAQKSIVDKVGFAWGVNNSHSGNLVVFRVGDNVHIGMVDLDVASFGKVDPYEENLQLSSYVYHDKPHTTVDPQRRLKPIPLTLLEHFRLGFEKGYANPMKREKIVLEELFEAFKLRKPIEAKPIF